MRNVSSTRMALLARKEQIKLAEQGRELLEQKRTALMEELLRVAGVVIEETETLQQLANVAVQALARAYATAGKKPSNPPRWPAATCCRSASAAPMS